MKIMVISQIRKTLLVILFSGLLLQVSGQEDKVSLTLADVISIAHQQSPDALISKHRYRNNYWRYRSYQATYRPMLTLDATLPNYSRSIDARLKTSRIIASDQVDFSRKSAVLLTPINWLEDEKFEASPPPLGFWTNTISPNNMHVTRINTDIRIYAAILVDFELNTVLFTQFFN